jgi:excinuclease UvrABC nuclease subunit
VPFDPYFPRPLIMSSVMTYAPSAPGVYGISNSREWIFVGQADDIREALLKHLQEPDTPQMRRLPTGFVFETCERAIRSTRVDRLVLEYEPICNRRSGAEHDG